MPPKKKMPLPPKAETTTTATKSTNKPKSRDTTTPQHSAQQQQQTTKAGVKKEKAKAEVKQPSAVPATKAGTKRGKHVPAEAVKVEVKMESDISDDEEEEEEEEEQHKTEMKDDDDDDSDSDHNPVHHNNKPTRKTNPQQTQDQLNRPDPSKVGGPMGTETTISSVMASQRAPQMQSKLDSLGGIELEYDMDDIDQLANHFGDIFTSLVYDQQSEQITRLLSVVNQDQNSIKSVLGEYNPNYQKQTFIGFNAGKQDLESALNLEKNSEGDMDLAINSTFFASHSTKDHSKNIDDIVDKIDLVAEHFGNRYENEAQVKAKIAKKREAKTAGKMWFDLPKTKMTQEAIQTWAILQNKGQLSNSYISVEKSKMPEYSQIGYFVGSGSTSDGGLTKRERKTTLAEQFLDEMKQNVGVKRRFKEYHAKKQSEWGSGKQYSGVKRKYTGKK